MVPYSLLAEVDVKGACYEPYAYEKPASVFLHQCLPVS